MYAFNKSKSDYIKRLYSNSGYLSYLQNRNISLLLFVHHLIQISQIVYTITNMVRISVDSWIGKLCLLKIILITYNLINYYILLWQFQLQFPTHYFYNHASQSCQKPVEPCL